MAHFMQERMCVCQLEVNVSEYCFLICEWVRVRKENSGVEEVYGVFV